jgi:hypothetical protein
MYKILSAYIKMSRTGKRTTSALTKISNADVKYEYLHLEQPDPEEVPNIKGTVSIGGYKNQWKDDKTMVYWPQYRLAAENSAILYTFASTKGLIREAEANKPVTFGPLITKGETEGGEVFPGAINSTVTIKKDVPEITDNDFEGEIPMYSLELMKGKTEKIKSVPLSEAQTYEFNDGKTFTVQPSYAPEDFIETEKELRSIVNKKSASKSEYSFADLAALLANPSTKKAKKGTRAGKEFSFESLVERVEEARKEKKDDGLYLDVTKLTTEGTKGKVTKATTNSIYALPEGHEHHDLFILNASLSNEDADNFYALLTKGDEEAADKMRRKAIKANERLVEKEKKVSPKKTTAAKKTKAAAVTKKVSPAKTVVTKKTKKEKEEEAEAEEEEEEEEEQQKPVKKTTTTKKAASTESEKAKGKSVRPTIHKKK